LPGSRIIRVLEAVLLVVLTVITLGVGAVVAFGLSRMFAGRS
jgi:hypothetical protein